MNMNDNLCKRCKVDEIYTELMCEGCYDRMCDYKYDLQQLEEEGQLAYEEHERIYKLCTRCEIEQKYEDLNICEKCLNKCETHGCNKRQLDFNEMVNNFTQWGYDSYWCADCCKNECITKIKQCYTMVLEHKGLIKPPKITAENMLWYDDYDDKEEWLKDLNKQIEELISYLKMCPYNLTSDDIILMIEIKTEDLHDYFDDL